MSEVRLLSHELEGVVICRVVGAENHYPRFYAGYTTPDGLYYAGQGETVKDAVLDCRNHIINCEPKLRPSQRAIMTQPKDRAAHLANISAGFHFYDRVTGRNECAKALLDNGLLILETTDKAPPRFPAPAPTPPPLPAVKVIPNRSEPDECGCCGGDPAECRPRRLGVDVFECDNSLRRKGVR